MKSHVSEGGNKVIETSVTATLCKLQNRMLNDDVFSVVLACVCGKFWSTTNERGSVLDSVSLS